MTEPLPTECVARAIELIRDALPCQCWRDDEYFGPGITHCAQHRILAELGVEE